MIKMTIKLFTEISNRIYPFRKEICGYGFDWPNYGGLPKKIINRLSPEAVDAIQDVIQSHFVRQRDFERSLKKRMEQLGEIIKK